MIDNLERYLQDFIEKRGLEVYHNFIKNNKQYIDLDNEFKTLEDNIINNLDDKSRLTYLEFENLLNSKLYLIIEAIYRQGITDGMKICRKLEFYKSDDITLSDK